jgi:AcrR family transcriptional regulator
VAARAGVSKSTLYVHFDSVDHCLRAAHAVAADCVLALVRDSPGPEAEPTRRPFTALLEFLRAEPSLAHLLGPAPAAGDHAIAKAGNRLALKLAALLRGDSERSASHLSEFQIVAAALAFWSDQVAACQAEDLPRLARELSELVDLLIGGSRPGSPKKADS